MVALLVALALAAPPRATISTPTSSAPLAVSSWCWARHCGAPIAASARTLTVTRGTLVRVRLAFEPLQARVAVAGRRMTVATHGHELQWRARAGGGLTVSVTGAR